MSNFVDPSTKYTGPGSRQQGRVSAEDNGQGSELYMLVLKDIIERADFGAKKYGHPLRTTAGVDFTVNAYQEALDLLIYLRGRIELDKKLNDLLHDAQTLIGLAMNDLDSPTWAQAANDWNKELNKLLLPPEAGLDMPGRTG